MIEIIACDLDETLLGKTGKVSQRNAEVIRQATDKGIHFVIATGRGFCTVQGTLAELGLAERCDEYVISFNGGALTENCGNKLLHYQGICFDKAAELYNRGLGYDVCIHVYTKTRVFVKNFVPSEREYLSHKMQVIEIDDDNIDFLRGHDIVKCVYMNEDRGYLEKIAEELLHITGNLDVSYSSNRYVEFNDKGVTKGSGLIRLAELLDIPIANTMAIGDNANDVAMLKAAGVGVAVANATVEAKAAADYITKVNFYDDAVAEAIESIAL